MTPRWRRKPDGTPFVDVFVDGKRHRHSLLCDDDTTKLTDEEAEARFREWIQHVLPVYNEEMPKDPGIVSLRKWTLSEHALTAGWTYATQESVRRAFIAIETHCGDMRLQEVGYRHIAGMVAEMRKTYSPSTIRTTLANLRMSWKAAGRSGWPVQVFEWPTVKVPARIPECFSTGQIRALQEASEGKLRVAVYLLSYFGPRPVDVCRLKWEDFSKRDDGTLMVRWIQQKTHAPVSVPVPAEVAAVLQEWAVRTGRRSGEIIDMRPNALCRSVRRLTLAVLGEESGPKKFRASVVSTLLEMGADRAAVGAITGHRSNAIEAYIASVGKQSEILLDRFSARLAQASGTPGTLPM